VALSHYVIDHMVPPDTAASHWTHQVRWAKTTRYCRPHGHIGTGLIYAMPYGLIALLGGWISGHLFWLGLSLFALAALKGVLQSLIFGWGVVKDANAVKYCWLYPLEDLMGFGAWVMSYIGGGKIVWRGEVYRLQMGGRMSK